MTQSVFCFLFQLALQTFGIQVPLLEESSDKPWHMVIQYLNSAKVAVYMSPVSTVFHTIVTVSIALKSAVRMITSILQF